MDHDRPLPARQQCRRPAADASGMRGVSPPRAALFALLRPLIACLFLLASSPLAGDATAQTGAQLRHARAQARGGRVAEGVLTRFSSGRLTLVARETHELSVRDLIRLDFTSRTPRLDRRDPVVILANGDLLAAQADEADPEYLGARWTRL
ncbi:MAG: hypothetical protein EHM42_06840, partial [Planctomycetaceae bacterium]